MTANCSETDGNNNTDRLDALLSLYMTFELAEGICLSVLSVITVCTNVLLLTAIWKDPDKTFRSPTTYFLLGLGIADLLTGATTEPFFAVYFITRFLRGAHRVSPQVVHLYEAGQVISTVTISSSYLIILGLSVSQYIAITWPHRYKMLVTRRRVSASVGFIWLYFICFAMTLRFSRIDQTTFLKVDLALHPVLISAVLFATLVLLYISFRGQVQRNRRPIQAKGKGEMLQRQFTIITFYLAAILLASALPHITIQFVWLYATLSLQSSYYVFMALRVRDLLLFLKVALDAFIYAWRLPAYRKALTKSIGCVQSRRKHLALEKLVATQG